MQTVLIIQAEVKHYRVPFFDGLYAALAADGVRLRVAYSDPSPREEEKGDSSDLSSTYGIKVPGYWLCGGRLLWQPLLREIALADLVIVEQANKHLINYILLTLSGLHLKQMAFWGHGRNRQSRRYGASERLKRSLLRMPNWWFAYTEGTARYLLEAGVAPEKITAVQNAVDTTGFHRQLADISDADIRTARKALGICEGAHVGLFCASVIRNKLPEFLIQSALEIRKKVPTFELVVVGGGPEHGVIAAAAGQYSWIHCLGPRFGSEKALYFRMADVFLMPGLVGLAILDAFCAGLPIITTSFPLHSPEIEYLKNGQNGIMTAMETRAYSDAVAQVFGDGLLLSRLREGALQSSRQYSMAAMVNRFRHGILQCLGGLKPAHEPTTHCGTRAAL
jgi:glycosyltransferase involved in cell wall biosynthesis